MTNSTSKFTQIAGAFAIMLLMLSSCNSIQPVLVLRPSDFISFGFFILIVSFFLALYLSDANSKRKLWIWFVVGLIFLPIPIIVTIIKLRNALRS